MWHVVVGGVCVVWCVVVCVCVGCACIVCSVIRCDVACVSCVLWLVVKVRLRVRVRNKSGV